MYTDGSKCILLDPDPKHWFIWNPLYAVCIGPTIGVTDPDPGQIRAFGAGGLIRIRFLKYGRIWIFSYSNVIAHE